jgi:HEAT repeat protein
LGSQAAPPNVDVARAALADPDPMVRFGALSLLVNLPPEQRWSLASILLSDPVRGVRVQTASLLADVPQAGLSGSDQSPAIR